MPREHIYGCSRCQMATASVVARNFQVGAFALTVAFVCHLRQLPLTFHSGGGTCRNRALGDTFLMVLSLFPGYCNHCIT